MCKRVNLWRKCNGEHDKKNTSISSQFDDDRNWFDRCICRSLPSQFQALLDLKLRGFQPLASGYASSVEFLWPCLCGIDLAVSEVSAAISRNTDFKVKTALMPLKRSQIA